MVVHVCFRINMAALGNCSGVDRAVRHVDFTLAAIVAYPVLDGTF